MVDDASDSPFGRGAEKLFDPEYRRAKEFKPPHVALSADLVGPDHLLDIIGNELDIDSPIMATLNKVNAYPTGGFFKPHRDTPLGHQHLGTITVCLPTEFTGGELVVKQDGQVRIFAWGTESPNHGSIRWAFLCADCEHEVLPVLSGTRVTAAYDVWYYQNPAPSKGLDLDIKGHPIHSALRALLADKELFMPLGSILGLGTRHAYPESSGDEISRALKGVDRSVKQVVDNLGLESKLVAAYDVYDEDEDEGEEDEIRISEYTYTDRGGPRSRPATLDAVDVHSVGQRYTVVTSDRFYVMDGAYTDRGILEYLKYNEGGYQGDVIWVTDVQAFGREASYISYGNEPSTATTYVGAALFVTIPPATQRA